MSEQEAIAIDIIRTEVCKITQYLLSEYKITLKEMKLTQYGVKYEVTNISNDYCILVIYYGKKGYKFVGEKVECMDVYTKVIEVFNNRDKLSIVKGQDIDRSRLDKLYGIFKPYANEEFDFSIFGDELIKHCKDDIQKNKIKANEYNFNELEIIYKKGLERE